MAIFNVTSGKGEDLLSFKFITSQDSILYYTFDDIEFKSVDLSEYFEDTNEIAVVNDTVWIFGNFVISTETKIVKLGNFKKIDNKLIFDVLEEVTDYVVTSCHDVMYYNNYIYYSGRDQNDIHLTKINVNNVLDKTSIRLTDHLNNVSFSQAALNKLNITEDQLTDIIKADSLKGGSDTIIVHDNYIYLILAQKYVKGLTGIKMSIDFNNIDVKILFYNAKPENITAGTTTAPFIIYKSRIYTSYFGNYTRVHILKFDLEGNRYPDIITNMNSQLAHSVAYRDGVVVFNIINYYPPNFGVGSHLLKFNLETNQITQTKKINEDIAITDDMYSDGDYFYACCEKSSYVKVNTFPIIKFKFSDLSYEILFQKQNIGFFGITNNAKYLIIQENKFY